MPTAKHGWYWRSRFENENVNKSTICYWSLELSEKAISWVENPNLLIHFKNVKLEHIHISETQCQLLISWDWPQLSPLDMKLKNSDIINSVRSIMLILYKISNNCRILVFKISYFEISTIRLAETSKDYPNRVTAAKQQWCLLYFTSQIKSFTALKLSVTPKFRVRGGKLPSTAAKMKARNSIYKMTPRSIWKKKKKNWRAYVPHFAKGHQSTPSTMILGSVSARLHPSRFKCLCATRPTHISTTLPPITILTVQ